ncbi:hypothetical protein E2320_022581, partial [Naja naja]
MDPKANVFLVYGESFTIVWLRTVMFLRDPENKESALFRKVLPVSLCNDHCSPGYWKRGAEGNHFCCYDCVPCPEGKISNQTDMENCFECSQDHYPNKEKEGCILKPVVFSTFEEISMKMLFLLMFLMHRVATLRCPASEAFPVPHEWYQPGELVIGGMVSHIFYHFYEIEFKEHPSLIPYDLCKNCYSSHVFSYPPNHFYHTYLHLHIHVSFYTHTLMYVYMYVRMYTIPQHIHLEDLPELFDSISIVSNKLMDPKANVFLVYGESFTIVWLRTVMFLRDPENKESALFRKVLPVSLCNDHCSPGYWKRGAEGSQFCCYYCAPCPEGKISNQTDMDDCFECSQDHYPNKEKEGCILKPVVFSTFEEISMKMLFLLMFLMHRVATLRCPASEAFPVPHEWYQPGELVIGGMVLPVSLCNDHCSPGYWKRGAEGSQFCCYYCAPCPEGKISNQTDMDDCFECSQDQYPNKEKEGCILKLLSMKMLFLLMFLMHRVATLRCPASEAFPVPHEWYQPGELVIGGMKIVTLSCPAIDVFLVPHEWYQHGDLIIGGIVSHIIYNLHEINFDEPPCIISYDVS